MKTQLASVFAFACAAIVPATVQAQNQAASPVKVTPETFVRAESDGRFAATVQRAGGVGRIGGFHEVPR